jgi:hypothetical protein
MTGMKNYYDNKKQPKFLNIGNEGSVNLNNLILNSRCPFCNSNVLSAGDKEKILIAYCPSCDMVWKIEFIKELEGWFMNVIELKP